jgi:hypothetical protein
VSTLLNLGKDPERERLNAIVRAECVSHPKPERQRAGRRRARRRGWGGISLCHPGRTPAFWPGG